jgi:hypothetical protein
VLKNKNIKILFTLITFVVVFIGIFAFINVNEKPSLEVKQQTNIIIPETSVTENKTMKTEATLNGTFKDGDAVHSGTGNVSIVKNEDQAILVFDDNFKVTNGPDLLVYLSPNLPDEPLGNFASLGKLKSISGKQAYNLPDNYTDYKTVVIWCRAFSVTFATAELKTKIN